MKEWKMMWKEQHPQMEHPELNQLVQHPDVVLVETRPYLQVVGFHNLFCEGGLPSFKMYLLGFRFPHTSVHQIIHFGDNP